MRLLNSALESTHQCVELLPLFQVLNGAVLQQVFVVEFTVNFHMCDDCHRVEAKDFWRAVVQVRQKVTKFVEAVFYAYAMFGQSACTHSL